MRLARAISLVVICLGGSFALATGASAAPIWNLDIHHNQTNLPPGGKAEYWFDVNNVGSDSTAGLTTLHVNLPTGVTVSTVAENIGRNGLPDWSCPGGVGTSDVTCTTSDPIPRHIVDRMLVLRVDVAANAIEEPATATLEGGGAANQAMATDDTVISSQAAGFGIVASTFLPDFFHADGLTKEREAGSHPDLLTIPFDFNSIDDDEENTTFHVVRKRPAEAIRNLIVDLPPGFVGAPTAVGECPQAKFVLSECPLSSQVGRIDAHLAPAIQPSFAPVSTAVFNLSHPRGAVTDLAFVVNGNPVHVKVGLDPGNRYAIRSVVSDINEGLPPFSQELTLWGVPASPSHDSERCPQFGEASAGVAFGNTDDECSANVEEKPFLTMPPQCESDNSLRIHNYVSWDHPSVIGPDIQYTMPGKLTDCDRARFEPEVQIQPTSTQANTPTGLNVQVDVAQNANPNALATPPVKRVVLTLPQGMSFSPSFADGLQSCSLAQMSLGTNNPITCPDASRIGEVSLVTPLLPKPAEGSMYLAAQGDNPFGTLFALYLVLHDTEERGVLLKVPGRIDVDPVTGQITTVFDDTPQFPFSELSLKFRSGPRAPLVNPPSCGPQTIGVQVASYAQPANPVDVSSTYQVTEGAGGTPCPSDAAHRPFRPKLSAGSLNPAAGAYSPFIFRLSRDDSEQELSAVTVKLPPGLTAKIAGIPACPDASLAAISSAEGTAGAELANPRCPPASQIGTLSAGLGAGPGPNYFPGKVYLAGPYKGAPLSLAIVVPGVAGPFDLGTVVVRTAVRVDANTAQVTAESDSFPTILHGVILRVRDVRLRIDRPETTLNPTSCSPMSVQASVSGVRDNLAAVADDSLVAVQDRFQVGNCASLGFKPKLALKLFGGTRRGAFPRLRATLKMPSNGANIKSASVALPHSEFLEQAHIRTICTRVQFRANACPAASVYGNAVARTPLFAEPLRGPVYLRSGNVLPDLVAVLKGPDSQPIEVDLSGRIDSVNEGIRTTFDVVPDAPVQSFTLNLQGGKKGLLVNSRNLCKSTNRATAKFVGHNGKTSLTRPVLQDSCRKRQRKGGKARPAYGLAWPPPAPF